jgi:hypothetical protein
MAYEYSMFVLYTVECMVMSRKSYFYSSRVYFKEVIMYGCFLQNIYKIAAELN